MPERYDGIPIKFIGNEKAVFAVFNNKQISAETKKEAFKMAKLIINPAKYFRNTYMGNLYSAYKGESMSKKYKVLLGNLINALKRDELSRFIKICNIDIRGQDYWEELDELCGLFHLIHDDINKMKSLKERGY